MRPRRAATAASRQVVSSKVARIGVLGRLATGSGSRSRLLNPVVALAAAAPRRARSRWHEILDNFELAMFMHIKYLRFRTGNFALP
jgi:hypothetical protein